MKIAIVGCGAMGSIYAGLLADAGNELFAIDRGDHVAAIAARGLRVEGASGDRTVAMQASTDVPNEVMDLVIVAVKAAGVPVVAPKLAPMLGEHTIVLTIQNGVGSADILAEHVGADRMMLGIAGGFGAAKVAPGHVFHNAMNVIKVGAYSGLAREDVERIATVWRAAGFRTETADDVVAMQWEKLICNVAYSGPCALTGMTAGEMMDDPEMGPVSRAAAIEAWTVARALGIGIKVDDPVRHVRDFAAGMPNARPSVLQDVERQRHSEIDVINGAIPVAAARAGLEAPVNATLTALVKQRERSFPPR